MFKRGVSPVIATVLLLVLTIIIGSVVFSVVLPFVNEKLGESKSCLDIFEGVEFAESRFNCFNATANGGKTGFSVKVNKDKVSAFKVSLLDTQGGSEVYEINKDLVASIPAGLTMYGGATTLVFPSVGGQKTYVASRVYESAEISALTSSGDTCSIADIVKFEPCQVDINL